MQVASQRLLETFQHTLHGLASTVGGWVGEGERERGREGVADLEKSQQEVFYLPMHAVRKES